MCEHDILINEKFDEIYEVLREGYRLKGIPKRNNEYFRQLYSFYMKSSKDDVDKVIEQTLDDFETAIRDNLSPRGLVYIDSKYKNIVINRIEKDYGLICGLYKDIVEDRLVPEKFGKTALCISIN